MTRSAETEQRGSFWPAAVVAITFVALLAAAGVRSAPSVLIVPLQLHFGWDRATVSFTAATGIFLYGLVGPFAAALMQAVGIRTTMVVGLALMAAATLASGWMSASWHFFLTWGVVSGLGSGAIASVLGATVVNRWFAARQGLVMGLFSASTATGSLVFLPVLAWLTRTGDWRPVVVVVGSVCLLLVPVVAFFLPERPSDVGVRRYGEAATMAARSGEKQPAPLARAVTVLREAAGNRTFLILFGAFFVCGFTTNGLVGTHLIAFCGDHGIAPVAAAGLLTTMGLFDLVGTTASGWLVDRLDPRRLLFVYFGLRGLSLLALPFLDFGRLSLGAFAVFYGLDWIATVPPTVVLTNRTFGEHDAPILFGWIMVGHQVGAAAAAFAAGLVRQEVGSYAPAFLAAGGLALVAGLAALAIPRLAARPATG